MPMLSCLRVRAALGALLLAGCAHQEASPSTYRAMIHAIGARRRRA